MKDLKPEEEADLIEMEVPMGTPRFKLLINSESTDEVAPGTDEDAPPPGAFEYYNWDE
jgi:hypothetical protein